MKDRFDEKLEAFLTGWPENPKEGDCHRFLEFALEGAEHQRAFPLNALVESGRLTIDRAREYDRVYSWVRLLHDMLVEQGRLLPISRR